MRESNRSPGSASTIPIAFDRDTRFADAKKQEEIVRELRRLGLSVRTLHARAFGQAGDRLTYEYVAMKRELLLERTKPLLRALDNVRQFDEETGLLTPRFYAGADMIQRGVTVAEEEFTRVLGSAGHRWADSSEKRVSLRREDLRGSPASIIARHPSTHRGLLAHVRSVQQKVMPDVRARAFGLIVEAVEREREKQLKDAVASVPADRRRDAADDLRTEVFRGARAAALRLTADFIRAFYPTFGATTNVQAVKDSIRGRRRPRPA